MKIATLNKAVLEARRFLSKAKEYTELYEKEKFEATCHGRKFYGLYQVKESASVKRASMDLTRVLSELRRS
jgi:hypothetical protein